MTYNLLFEIKFDVKSERKHPIKSGYRPGFKILNQSFFSGIINLIDSDDIKPGEICMAIVSFFSDEPFKNVCVGDLIDFYEIPHKLGTSRLVKIMGWGNVNTN